MNERELAELLRNNPDLQVDGPPINNNAQIDGTRVVPVRAAKMSERDLQAAIIAECDLRAIHRPEYGSILAIPNGQYRQGQRMEPGLRPGIPDLFLPLARHGHHGLFLELKISPNGLSESQRQWINLLRKQGYRCEIVKDSVDAAMRIIDDYINGGQP